MSKKKKIIELQEWTNKLLQAIAEKQGIDVAELYSQPGGPGRPPNG